MSKPRHDILKVTKKVNNSTLFYQSVYFRFSHTIDSSAVVSHVKKSSFEVAPTTVTKNSTNNQLADSVVYLKFIQVYNIGSIFTALFVDYRLYVFTYFIL